jgi:hypothetical protein
MIGFLPVDCQGESSWLSARQLLVHTHLVRGVSVMLQLTLSFSWVL